MANITQRRRHHHRALMMAQRDTTQESLLEPFVHCTTVVIKDGSLDKAIKVWRNMEHIPSSTFQDNCIQYEKIEN